jgi:hypothetical protein
MNVDWLQTTGSDQEAVDSGNFTHWVTGFD